MAAYEALSSLPSVRFMYGPYDTVRTESSRLNLKPLPCHIVSSSLDGNPSDSTLTLIKPQSEKQNPKISRETLNAPILERLNSLANSGDSPFHFPGHKKGAGAPDILISSFGKAIFEHDLPELPELDNLFSPSGVILESQEQASNVFGSEKTFFVVNGSTVGIHAAVMATCGFPGSSLVLPRNSHQCAIEAMVLSGAHPHYILPEYDSHWNIPLGVDPKVVEITLKNELGQDFRSEMEELGHNLETKPGKPASQTMDTRDRKKNKKIGAVLIVSPTYHGACSDIKSIAEICHSFGVPLVVDEAHGGHFKFHKDLPSSALEQGADIVIQSTHKVLGSLTQSAMVHVQGKFIDFAKVSKCLQLLQSSSPSYLFLASLDAATWQMSGPNGHSLLENAIFLAKEARRGLANISGVEVLSCEKSMIGESSCNYSRGVVDWDPLRVTVGIPSVPLNGYELDDILRIEFGVVAELPSLNALTFAFSFGTNQLDVDRLVTAYEQISKRFASNLVGSPPPPSNHLSLGFLPVPLSVISPRDAFFTESERVQRSDSIGRLSAEILCPYPPGVPVLVPGEVVTLEAIKHLIAVLSFGGLISGAFDSNLETIAVLK